MIMISEKTSKALDELTGAFFDLNRTLDRCVSVLQNTWAMPQAAGIIHLKLAHLMPLLADKVTEIKDRYNLDSVYPATHGDARTYDNLQDMFETVLSEFEEVYKMFQMIIDMAQMQKDFNVVTDLYDLLEDYNEVMGQIMTLCDKAIQMPDKFDTFDKHISSWGIVGLE